MDLYDMVHFGSDIKHLRESIGLTQSDVYKQTGISEDTLRRIENGKSIPKLETLFYLSLIYKTNLIQLINSATIFNVYSGSHLMDEVKEMIINNDYQNIDFVLLEIDAVILKYDCEIMNQLLLDRLLIFKDFVEIVKKYKYNPTQIVDKEKLMNQIILALTKSNESFSLEVLESCNLNPIEIRLMLVYCDLLRTLHREKQALMFLNILKSMTENKQYYDSNFKELTIKINYYIVQCYHELYLHKEVLITCNEALTQCIVENQYTLMPFFLFRKSIALHFIGDVMESNTLFAECKILLKLTNKLNLVNDYQKIFDTLQ